LLLIIIIQYFFIRLSLLIKLFSKKLNSIFSAALNVQQKRGGSRRALQFKHFFQFFKASPFFFGETYQFVIGAIICGTGQTMLYIYGVILFIPGFIVIILNFSTWRQFRNYRRTSTVSQGLNISEKLYKKI
jgi:hypothetical protein